MNKINFLWCLVQSSEGVRRNMVSRSIKIKFSDVDKTSFNNIFQIAEKLELHKISHIYFYKLILFFFKNQIRIIMNLGSKYT